MPPVHLVGVNTVTSLVEIKKPQLVVIVHDVDPTEVVVFLPALCQKMFPYCIIIKGKSRLGHPVNRNNCTTVAFTQVNLEDKGVLAKRVEAIWANYKRDGEITTISPILYHGRQHPGSKVMAHSGKLQKAKAKEMATILG